MSDNIVQALESVRYHLVGSDHKAVIDEAIEVIERQREQIKRQANNIRVLLKMDATEKQRGGADNG